MQDWKDWLALFFLACIGIAMLWLVIAALLGEYRAGRWDRTRREATVLNADLEQEGTYGCGFLGLFIAFIIGIKIELSLLFAALSGVMGALVAFLLFALAFRVLLRVLIFFLDRLVIPRLSPAEKQDELASGPSSD